MTNPLQLTSTLRLDRVSTTNLPLCLPLSPLLQVPRASCGNQWFCTDPQPKAQVHTKIPKGPLRRNNAYGKYANLYSIEDDLAHSPAAISTLELLHSYLSKIKSLLTAMGFVDPSNDHLIVFDVDRSEHPPIRPFVTFQIPVKVWNANIFHCIIDEGASTNVMSGSVLKQLRSPELAPSTITL